MYDLLLIVLLRVLGRTMSFASKFHPSLRAQITRALTFQLSAGSRASQVWMFDAPQRRIRSYPGRVDAPDCALHFHTSGQALRALTSSQTVSRVVAGMHDGSIQLHGSAFVLLWFHGLSRKFFKRGRNAGPRRELPHRYLTSDSATWGSENVIVEPPVERLDPEWTAAYRARATLHQIRSTTGEPVLEP